MLWFVVWVIVSIIRRLKVVCFGNLNRNEKTHDIENWCIIQQGALVMMKDVCE